MRETLRGGGTAGNRTDLVAFFPFFVLGLVLARGSRWRFVALAAVPILWSTTWIPSLLAGDAHGPAWNDVHDAFPFVAVVVAARCGARSPRSSPVIETRAR